MQDLLKELEAKLNAKTIHDLRQVARVVGVFNPSHGKKERLVGEVLKIASGESEPITPNNKGARPKSNSYDRLLVSEVWRLRGAITGDVYENFLEDDDCENCVLTDNSVSDFIREGYLEVQGDKYIIHCNPKNGDGVNAILVGKILSENFNLKTGDFLRVKFRHSTVNDSFEADTILSLNHKNPDIVETRPEFETLGVKTCDRQLKISSCGNEGRILDIIAPLGFGQRITVTGEHGSGKTALLKKITAGIKGNACVRCIAVLAEPDPEDIVYYKNILGKDDVFVLSDDVVKGRATVKLVVEHLKRCAESKLDAVLIVDDVTRLTKLFNSDGLEINEKLEVTALNEVKRIMSLARNLADGGSVTVVSALAYDREDELEYSIFNNLKSNCNALITLSSKCARRHINPPVDIENTYNSQDIILIDGDKIKLADKLRSLDILTVAELFSRLTDEEIVCELSDKK